MSKWLGIQLRHLAALRAVVEERSFNQAASKLGYTQPAVSQQIRALERIVGQRLLNRQVGSNRVTLTPAGERLLSYAGQILEELLAAEADLSSFAEGGGDRLAVGMYESIGVKVVPIVLPPFRLSWPGVRVEITEGWNDEELLGQLQSGALDLTFATSPLDPNLFRFVEIMRDPIVTVVPAGSPLAAKQSIEPGDLKGVPLIGYRKCKSADLVTQYLRRHGVRPRFAHYADENALIQALVRAEAGTALLPRLAVDADDEGVHVLSLGPPAIFRSIVLAWSSGREPSLAALAFVERVRQACPQAALEPADFIAAN
jgi:DNA-binding transcriptional LysR family regulator